MHVQLFCALSVIQMQRLLEFITNPFCDLFRLLEITFQWIQKLSLGRWIGSHEYVFSMRHLSKVQYSLYSLGIQTQNFRKKILPQTYKVSKIISGATKKSATVWLMQSVSEPLACWQNFGKSGRHYKNAQNQLTTKTLKDLTLSGSR